MWQRQRNQLWSRHVARSFRAFGAGTTLDTSVILWNTEQISLGQGVSIGAGSRLWGPDAGSGEIVIGDGCNLVGGCSLIAAGRIELGRKVLIAWGASIVDFQHGTGEPDVPIMDQPYTGIAPVTVGDGAWIGHGAVIMPGVTIGRNAVIGANAVVRSDVPDHGVAVGIPARVL